MLGILPNKKKMGAVIMAKMSGDGMKDEFSQGPETQLDSSYAYEDAAKRMITAIESKDIKALVNSMKDIFMLCELEEDQTESGPENGDAA